MTDADFVPFPDRYVPPGSQEEALKTFHDAMRRRRSVREFSDRDVPQEIIEWLVRCAHTAPSGANKQPWRFVCVKNPEVKQKIRTAAEVEERECYSRRANKEWLDDLAPLGTDDTKEQRAMTPGEALSGATCVAARALGRDSRGSRFFRASDATQAQ